MPPLRTFVITQEEPFYVPKVVRHLINHQGGTYEIVGGSVLKPHRKSRTMYDWFKERARVYSYGELALAGTAYGASKLRTLSPLSNNQAAYSVTKLLAQNDVAHYPTGDVNAPNYVHSLKELEIDVILSISPPQIFKDDLLASPRKACLNAHGTLLPRHRGVFGSWWTLYCDDAEAGSTIHTMELRLDAGEIVWQKSFPVRPSDTQYSIAYETKRLLAEGLVETLAAIHENRVQPISPTYAESYHRAPTKEEGRRFREAGKKIIQPRDFRFMLSQRF